MSELTSHIVTMASLITAISVIIGVIVKMNRFIDDQHRNAEKVKEVRSEQALMFTALCACLDGLEQLGANHSVPKAKGALEEWINTHAHD